MCSIFFSFENQAYFQQDRHVTAKLISINWLSQKIRKPLKFHYGCMLFCFHLHVSPCVDCTNADCKPLPLSVQNLGDCTSRPRFDLLISDYILFFKSFSVAGESPSLILLYTKTDMVFKFFSSIFCLQYFPIPFQGTLTDVLWINCYKA